MSLEVPPPPERPRQVRSFSERDTGESGGGYGNGAEDGGRDGDGPLRPRAQAVSGSEAAFGMRRPSSPRLVLAPATHTEESNTDANADANADADADADADEAPSQAKEDPPALVLAPSSPERTSTVKRRPSKLAYALQEGDQVHAQTGVILYVLEGAERSRRVRAGTVAQLLDFLVCLDNEDPSFLAAFALCWPMFAEADPVLGHLVRVHQECHSRLQTQQGGAPGGIDDVARTHAKCSAALSELIPSLLLQSSMVFVPRLLDLCWALLGLADLHCISLAEKLLENTKEDLQKRRLRESSEG
jgi:hypothetical protein